MRFERYIVFLVAALLLVACGTKKKAASDQKSEVSEPTWHTCVIQGAKATVIRGEDAISATVTMQTVRDSMLVISVMPMFGMEMFRLEATPIEMITIDKMHAQYARATYEDLNKKLTPDINWDILQQLCSAELPTGNEKARLVYSFGEEKIELVVNYTDRQLDLPIRINHLRIDKYTPIDISRWL